MPRLAGTISITGLPPNRGLLVHLCFFAVDDPSAPVPYDGDPPADTETDCIKVYEQVDLEQESQEPAIDIGFSAEPSGGWHFVQVRVVLFQFKAGRIIAQAEQFFFGRRPVQLGSEPVVNVTFPVVWPAIPLEDLHQYGTVQPQNQRPWWKFW